MLYASYGDARGSRTLDSAVKERRLNRLTMAPYKLVFPSRQSGNGFRKLTLELVSAPLILNNYHPFLWREERDLNTRTFKGSGGFQDRSLKPLEYPPVELNIGTLSENRTYICGLEDHRSIH